VSFEPRLALGEGAAEAAPTAPHATLRGPGGGKGKATGPERFWRRRNTLSLPGFASLLLHLMVSPWNLWWLLFSAPHIDIKDQEGELVIPADLFDEPAPVAPVATQQASNEQGDLPGGSDAAARDAMRDGEGDADMFSDDGGIAYLDEDGGDGGVGSDANSLLGGLAGLSSAPNNITITINFDVIRSHPSGSKLQPILAAIPEWKQFMSGSSIDPYRDTNWMMIEGPSLLDTTRDAVLIGYSATDADVEKAIEQVSAQYTKGGAFDIGVPGVKAWRAYAHGAERVLLRARWHAVLIVPPGDAKNWAKVLAKKPPKAPLKAGEALRVHSRHPGGSVPQIFPPSMTWMRMWLVPRNSDGGADLFMEGDCPDPAAATQAADDMKATATRYNSPGLRLMSGNLLGGFDVHADGSTVKAHLPGTKSQVDFVITIAGLQVGVSPPAASGP